MLSTLHPDRRRILGQLARFVVSGAFVTAIGVGVYAIVALLLRWHPQIGNFMAYVIAVATGYFMHSSWSFKDHGAERTHATKFRFIVVSIISYALNSFWVWLIFTRLELRTGGADHPNAVRDARRDLRSQPAVGFSLMERAVYEAMAEHDERHWWYRARREVVAALIRRKVHPPKGAQDPGDRLRHGSQPSDARRVRLGGRP